MPKVEIKVRKWSNRKKDTVAHVKIAHKCQKKVRTSATPNVRILTAPHEENHQSFIFIHTSEMQNEWNEELVLNGVQA